KGSMKQYIFEFGYTGTDKHIGFKIINNGSFSSIHIDDVVWEPIPTCPDVDDIMVSSTTTSSAKILWADNDTATSWDVAYGNESETDPNTLPFVNSTTNSNDINGLSQNTTYNVWVRTVCPTENGAWIGPVKFKTLCDAVDNFNENFDGVTTPNLPECWTKIIRGNTVSEYANVVTSNYPFVYSAPNNLAIENGSSESTDDIILVSPNLINTTNQPFNKYRLKFYATRPSYNSDVKLEVGTLSSNNDSAVFLPIETIDIGSSSEQYVVNFSSYSGTDTFVGLKLSAPKNSSVNIDDIIWELAPNCKDVTKINVPQVTASSAKIVWTPGGNEVSWNVAHSATATDPSELPYVNVINPIANISDLTDNTTYKVWVRSVCDSENGAWIGPIAFTTSCLPTTTLNENFDSVTTPNLPSCWSKIIRGSGISPYASVGTNTYTAVVSQPNCASMYRDGSNDPYEIIFVTPSLSNLTDTSFTITFETSGPGTIEIGTLDSNTNTATFNSIKSYTTSYTVQQITTDLNSYNGTDTYIGIRATPSIYSEIGIDNFTWTKTLSTNQFDSTNFSYYPNPVKNILNINYIENISTVSVYNILGQEILVKSVNENKAKIDMSTLAKGSYMVKVTTNNLVKTIKVLKD
ncbi:MAG TPA: T9SS type A sorting domain-containing protein, partial [Flavobacterium sp.]|nr:T9SS type A sorting domain-containing protein [Flavobacterium sp.]